MRFTTLVLSTFALVGLAMSTVNAQTLKPTFTDSERFGETFTASFLGEDDSVFLFQYIFSNAGFGNKKGGCRLLAIPKGTSGKNFAKRVDKDGWQYVAAQRKLKVGTCALEDLGNRIQFSAKIDGAKAVLKIEAGFKAKPMPKVRAAKGFFEAEVLVAGSPASVRYTHGGRTIESTGHAYLDHTRSTATMSDLINEVYRIRLMGKNTELFQVSNGPRGKKGWTFKSGDHALKPLAASAIKLTPSKSTPRIEVKASGRKASIVAQKVLFRYRPVEAYGMLGRLASPIIGNPETTTFLVTVTLADGSSHRALMERTLVNP